MPVPILLMNRNLTHGGTERQIVATALALDRARFTPHVAYVEEGIRAEELRRAGVPLLRLPLNSYANGTTWTSARTLRRYIREHRIRLVHTFDFSIGIFGVPACSFLPGVQVFSSQRCYTGLIPPRLHWVLHATHRMAKRIVVNADALRRHLVEDYGHPADKIDVCYNGIDTARFSPGERSRLPDLPFPILAGVVCVLRPEKNLGMLVRAFAKVAAHRDDVGLLLVGSGSEQEALRKQASDLGIGGRCRFVPSVANVVDYLRGIDVFVHPSLSEGLPNAVMEAMACGCCVLSSNVGGSAEVVAEGESGMLFAPDDPATLENKLCAVLTDPSLRQRLAQSAVARIQSLFTTERSAQQMQRIYCSVLEGGPGA
jgi:glycosyltransferase involved in cell wall biosynthesis